MSILGVLNEEQNGTGVESDDGAMEVRFLARSRASLPERAWGNLGVASFCFGVQCAMC